MDSIEAHVRAEAATELERLGSDRGLIALTDADLSPAQIRTRIAGVLAGVAEYYERWASEDDDFATAAATARTLAEAVAGEASIEAATAHPAVASLADFQERPARAGAGLIGAPVVLDGWALQAVSFFINEADEEAADQFRAVRDGLDELIETGESALEDDDREQAAKAALDLVTTAYEAYVETLDGLGLDPKTVC